MKKKNGNKFLDRRMFLKVGVGIGAAILPMRVSLGKDRSLASPQAGHEDPMSLRSQNSKSETAIPTATGTLLPSALGITSVHEHLPVEGDSEQQEKSRAFAIEELKKAKVLGLQTIVDVGPTENVAAIGEVSQATGVNIICCTGFYVLKEDQQSLGVKDFETHMTKEIEDGIQGAQIRPGVIKVATRGLPHTPAEIDLLKAAAHVQRQYHLPMCIHSVSGCVEQQQVLEQAGADLNHCYFSHIEATFGWSGRNVGQEIDYLERVVKKGSTLSFNNFGNWNHTKPEDLAKIISELTRRGYDDRMVATMDVIWSFENGAIKLLWEDTNDGGKDRTYSYLLRKAVPWMKENGISAKSIDKFIIHNPKRLFTR